MKTRLLNTALGFGLSAFIAGTAYVAPAAAQTIDINVWSRQDTSGPLRPGNLITAGEILNRTLEAAGSEVRVNVIVTSSPAPGFDEDALQLLKVFAIGEGPDIFIAAHEWIGEFARNGYAWNLEEHIASRPEFYADIIPALWGSTLFDGKRYAIPQDAEARMFFYNKKLMRQAGISEDDIESLPQRVLDGEFTLADLSALAKKVVDNSDAEFGILHRPSKGPDYLMIFNAYGSSFLDPESGKLLLEEDKLAAAFEWFAGNVRMGVTPANNTAMDWDAIRAAFYKEDKAAFWMYGIWDLARAFAAGVPEDEEGYFKQMGWIASPAVVRGGTPNSLTHPIVYAVSALSENRELAATIVGLASSAELNTLHAIGSFHIGIKNAQLGIPAYAENWALRRATELLKFTQFMPNHPDFGRLNGIIYTALQGVETGRLSSAEAAEFVIDEAQGQFSKNLMVK